MPDHPIEVIIQLIELVNDIRLKWKSSAEHAAQLQTKVQQLTQRLNKVEPQPSEMREARGGVQASSPLKVVVVARRRNAKAYETLDLSGVDFTRSDLDKSNSPNRNQNTDADTTNGSDSFDKSVRADGPDGSAAAQPAALEVVVKVEDCNGVETELVELPKVELKEGSSDLASSNGTSSSGSSGATSPMTGSVDSAIGRDLPTSSQSSLAQSDDQGKNSLDPVDATYTIGAASSKTRRSNSLPGFFMTRGNWKTKLSLIRTPSLNVTKTAVSDGDIVDDREQLFDEIDRAHEFVNRRNFMNISCALCARSVGFSMMHIRCQVCAKKVTMPCIPIQSRFKKKKVARLGDLCPDQRPMVPQLVVYCCIHLERCHSELDLYRGLGNEAGAHSLLAMFNKRGMPNLVDFGPLTVAGAIKLFLSQLKEFKSAAHIADDEGMELSKLISSLPQAHCDTMVYLVRHFKRIVDATARPEHTMDVICQNMGPIFFGSENSEPDQVLVLRQILNQLNVERLTEMMQPLDKKINRIPSNCSSKQRPKKRRVSLANEEELNSKVTNRRKDKKKVEF